MNFIIDSILNQNTGPKKTRHSALDGMLREHLIVVSKLAFEVAFYRPKHLVRSFTSSSVLSSATSLPTRRFSAKFSAK
jgi:hypothetical protein